MKSTIDEILATNSKLQERNDRQRAVISKLRFELRKVRQLKDRYKQSYHGLQRVQENRDETLYRAVEETRIKHVKWLEEARSREAEKHQQDVDRAVEYIMNLTR